MAILEPITQFSNEARFFWNVIYKEWAGPMLGRSYPISIKIRAYLIYTISKKISYKSWYE